MTLYPAAQNFLVEIRDECDKPGTMCASVTWLGSHGMSKLHVWVNCIRFPLGSRMCIGFWVGVMLIAGDPLTRK